MAKLFNDKKLEKEFKEFVAKNTTGFEEPELDKDGKPVVDASGKPVMKSVKPMEFSPIRWIVRFVVDVAISRARDKAAKEGRPFDEARARQVADDAVNAIGDGRILEWLRDGGFEALIQFFLQLLAIFMG